MAIREVGLIFVVLITSSMTSVHKAKFSCPDEYHPHPYKGHQYCYRLYSKVASYDQAEKICQEDRGHLVHTNSRRFFIIFMMNVIKTYGKISTKIMTGLKCKEGKCTYADGSEGLMRYFKVDGKDGCVFVTPPKFRKGKLDVDCNAKAFVCLRDKNVVKRDVVKENKGIWVPHSRSRGHYRVKKTKKREECETECLNDASCAAATMAWNYCHLHPQINEEPDKADPFSMTQFVKTDFVKSRACFGVRAGGQWLRFKKAEKKGYRTEKAGCAQECALKCDKDPKCVGASIRLTADSYSEPCNLYSNVTSGFFAKDLDVHDMFYVKLNDHSSVSGGVFIPTYKVDTKLKIPASTKDQCEQKCEQDSTCLAVSMQKSSWWEDKVTISCFKSTTLRSRTGISEDKDWKRFADSWATFIKTRGQAKCGETKNRGYWLRHLTLTSSTIIHDVTVECHDDCAGYCEKAVNCVTASYAVNERRCSLISGYDDKKVSFDRGHDLYLKLRGLDNGMDR